jgi:hypothetical protein
MPLATRLHNWRMWLWLGIEGRMDKANASLKRTNFRGHKVVSCILESKETLL